MLYLRWEDNDGGQLFNQVVRAMKKEFVNPLAQKEQNLNWKDSNMTVTYEYDVFISHASEDKEDFVRPLAEELRKRGYRVWYDEFSLSWGDSLSSAINKGISQSKFGIIVLSHNFFNKKWPESELNGFVSKEALDRKVILPIWHQVTKKQVSKYYPILADKLAIDSSQGIDYVVNKFVDIMTQNSATLPVTSPVKLPTNTTEMPRKAPSNVTREGGQLFKDSPVQLDDASGAILCRDYNSVNTEASSGGSSSIPGSPQNLKRGVLTERLAKLEKEYTLINQQIDETVDEGTRFRLEQKANRIFRELEKVQSELNLNDKVG
ncbi:hypothetical protein BZZ01_10715 [Nostocales cyanobacterium HT-58-2]|nr:hypothetical protein BZZ01_10715 [Nostocales cyanobacterium HT-58-2]